ncbi:MAG: nucleotidyltransferase domain-containing protein [Candidatus Paceibacteria bacterium]
MDREKHKLDEFFKNIKKNFLNCKILLFGSRARNEEWKTSDYDLIIVSDYFKGIHWLKRISLVMSYWELDRDLDILPYTYEEFEHKLKESSFVKEIVSHSREI